MPIGSVVSEADATIAAGQSLSNIIQLNGAGFLAMQMPGTWTAAVVTFLCDVDGNGTPQTFRNTDGTEYTITAAAGQTIRIPAADFAGVQEIQVRSGTAAAPVPQTAQAVIKLGLRPV